jgi:CheY-like chemotaxis protein
MEDSRQYRLLYAEDNPDDVFLFQRAARKFLPGWTIQVTRDGRETLGNLLSGRTHALLPDLVVLDYWLPGLNGAEVLQMIRRSKDLNHLPVVLFTAAILPDHHMQLLRVPGVELVRKPSDVKQYQSAIMNIARFFNTETRSSSKVQA